MVLLLRYACAAVADANARTTLTRVRSCACGASPLLVQSPSFETDSELDAAVKKEVISQSMMMSCISEHWLLDNARDLVPGFIMPRGEHTAPAGVAPLGAPAAAAAAAAADPAATGDVVLTPYGRGILQLREAFEKLYCGRFVKVLPYPGSGANPVRCTQSCAASVSCGVAATGNLRFGVTLHVALMWGCVALSALPGVATVRSNRARHAVNAAGYGGYEVEA